MSISSTIKSIQDIMRKDVGVDGDAQRLSQLVWMLFLKIFDDRESEWELLQDHYQSPLPEAYRWRKRGVAIFAKDFSGLPARKISKKLRDRLCLRLPRSVLVTSFRPNKGSKHRFQMT
jgi:type I restriction-modification system DNA methylase subunit